MYEIKIQKRYQNECTLRFVCITYFFHSDSIVSIRSKLAVRAGRTEHLTHLQFLSCVGTRCSLLQSVYHVVIKLVSRLNSSERKPLCSCRLLLSAVPLPEIADTFWSPCCLHNKHRVVMSREYKHRYLFSANQNCLKLWITVDSLNSSVYCVWNML
jgi:hypothetical protein